MNELEQQHIANAHVLVWVGASGDDDNADDDDEVYVLLLNAPNIL